MEDLRTWRLKERNWGNAIAPDGTESVMNICPCCGFDGLEMPAYADIGNPPYSADSEPPYATFFGQPSFEVCSCCGYEFGNDDEPGTAAPSTFEEYLTTWISEGCVWFDQMKRHQEWTLAEQLHRLGR